MGRRSKEDAKAGVRKGIKPSLPEVDLNKIHGDVWSAVGQRYDYKIFRADLEYLREEGKSFVKIARRIGTSRQNLYAWSRGWQCPSNTFYVELVHEWAEEVRKMRKLADKTSTNLGSLL